MVLTGRKVHLLLSWVDFVVLNDGPDDFSDILLLLESLTEGSNSVEFGVRGVVIPRYGRHGIFRLEQICDGGVVNDNDVLHGTAEASQILDKSVVEEGAMLTEEQVRAHLCGVELLHQRLSILGQRCSEDDQFINFVHLFQELSYKWSDQDVDGADLTINFDWQHDISTLNWLE